VGIRNPCFRGFVCLISGRREEGWQPPHQASQQPNRGTGRPIAGGLPRLGYRVRRRKNRANYDPAATGCPLHFRCRDSWAAKLRISSLKSSWLIENLLSFLAALAKSLTSEAQG
jgi:hypothetical protein